MLLILDRDGVINFESDAYIKSPEEWIPIPGSLNAISQLNRAGHIVVVATNQAGVGRGIFTETMLLKIHAHMEHQLALHGGHLHGIYYCPHHPDDQCNCRKPKPGLLLKIARDFPNEFNESIFIGDSWRDIEAAQAAGCRAALVRTGFGENTLKTQVVKSIPVYDDLADFTKKILSHN